MAQESPLPSERLVVQAPITRIVKHAQRKRLDAEAFDEKFFGSLRFLESPAMPPSKFVRFEPDLDEKTLLELMCGPLELAASSKKRGPSAKKAFNWKLPPPCAMISLAGTFCDEDEGIEFVMDESKALMLRRGLAEAVDRTKAWIITDGNRRTLSTRIAGQAVHYHMLEFESNDPPICIGICDYGEISQDAACRNEFARSDTNGRVHRYSSKEGGSSEITELDPYHTHFLMVDGVAKQVMAEGRGNESGNESGETALMARGRFEKYISSNDVSGDGIQTPKVVLVVAGGLATFRLVRNALDPTDEATGTSVPVLVVTNSGYAAQDIAYYCATGKLPWDADSGLALDAAHEWRCEAYKQAAELYLPEILAFGKQTGLNTTKQLSFCTVAAETQDGGGGKDLATALQESLLNDCPNAVEEALLTIQWANHTILQEQLTNEKAMVEIQHRSNSTLSLKTLPPGSIDMLADCMQPKPHDKEGKRRFDLSRIEVTSPLYKMLTQPSVLQLGLTAGSSDVSRTLLSYFESPMAIRLDELFEEKHNRYRLQAVAEMWKPRHELIKLLAERLVTQAVESGEMVLKGSAPSLPAHGGSSSDSPLAPKPSTSPEGLTRQRSQTSLTGSLKDLGAGAFRAGASLKDMGVTGVGSATGVGTAALSKGVNFLSNFAQMHSSNGKDASPSFEVLSEMVTGYKTHLLARNLRNEGWLFPSRPELGPTSTHTTWCDVMMWAILSGNHQLAELVWPRCTRPMCAALLSAQLCKRLAMEEECRPDRRELLEKATYYEDLATETLRCVRSSAVAYALLSVIPWELCSAPKKGDGEPDKHVVPLWASSVLDEASTADGLRSFPCRHFIGHRHSQETLGRYFAGNYPESKAQIAPGSSLIAILMQCLMPFLPGTIVEVSPVSLPHEHVLSGPSVTEKFKDLEADNEVGADEQQALQEMREALSIGEDEEREKAMKLKEAGLLSFLDDEVTDLREDLKSFRFLAFYNIPKVKFVLDFFFYIIYVVQNTFIAIRLRQVDPNCVNALNMSCTNEDAGYTTASPISVNEVIFWVWCGAKMLNELDNIKSFDKVGLAEYIGDTWNQQDVLFFIITAVIIPLRLWFNIHTEPPEPDVAGAPMHTLTALPVDLYSILLVLNYFRILRYLSYYKSVGVLVLVVNYMMVDVAVFSTLLFLITIGFGFAFFTLLPTRVSDAPGIGFFLGSHPVYDSWWGMFGDYDRGSMYRDLGTQMPTAIIAPTMLFLYEFFSVVLLMNLLVALMSDTYARVTAEGELNWQYARAGLIREYLTQSPLPAPFNVLYYVFYRIPMNLYRWHRKNSVGEKLLEAGFKYLPTQRMLASLRKAEQEAVRKLLDQREKEEALEATAMIEAMSARLEKMQRDSTTKFEAMNQRFDELLRKVEDSSTKSVTKHDLSWAAPLDKVWHAPPAFTKADEQKLVTFSPVTWALMRGLKHAEAVSRNMEDVGGTGTPLVQWDERFGCRVALSMVTLSDVRRGGVEETRLVCWQGEWSKDGKGGTFAKVFDPSKGARDSDDADAMMQSIVTSADALPDEPLVIERVEEDAVMKIVTLSVQRATPISGRFSFVLENPERFPLNEDMLKLKPEVVVAAGAAVAPPTSTPSALRMPIKRPPGQAPGQAPGQDPMAA